MSSSDANILAVWERGISFIISYFSAFILEAIGGFGSRIELTILVLLSFCLWLIIDHLIRTYAISLSTVQKNNRWKYVIISILDFVNTLMMFLLAQIFFKNLSSIVKVSNLNFGETILVIFAVLVIVISIFQNIRGLLYFSMNEKLKQAIARYINMMHASV